MPHFPENKHFLRPDTHTYVRLLTVGLFACCVPMLVEGFQMYNQRPCLSQFANAVVWQTATINEKLWTCSKKPGKDWNMVKNKKLQPLAIIIAIRRTSLISFKGRVCVCGTQIYRVAQELTKIPYVSQDERMYDLLFSSQQLKGKHFMKHCCYKMLPLNISGSWWLTRW